MTGRTQGRPEGQVLVETLFWAPLFALLAAGALWFGRLWLWRMRLAAEAHRAVFLRVDSARPPAEIEETIRRRLAGGPLREIQISVRPAPGWGPTRVRITAELPAPMPARLFRSGRRGILLREEAACFEDTWVMGFPGRGRRGGKV